MTCPRCRTENPPQAKFCLECAAPLAARCASCGTQLPASAKFCLECAHPVGGSTAGPSRFASPDAYTPKHLAEKILTSKAALEGERKQVTVLFADLKGSMELLANRDPEDARKLLDPVLEHMMEAVHRYEGTVNQVMGDGIMALFGAPLAHEDHAVRACYAALRMQDTVKRYAEGVRRTQGVTIRIRVGLNSGEVLVRAIGSDLHMDYTAVGQTTHLDIQVPPTVQAILAARIDRLSPEDKHLLQSAAVIGKDVPFALLAAIADEQEEELRRRLSRLQAAELVYELCLFPDLEYSFKHALTHEVAYASVLHERGRGLHARLVDVIETLYADRRTEHVDELARHALLGEIWHKAATYLNDAAAKASGRCAFRQAAGSLEQAVGALGRLPESRTKTKQSIHVHCRIRAVLLLLGETEKGLGHLREAERLARAIDDRHLLAMVLGAMSHHYWVTGYPVETRRYGEEALEIAKAVGNLAAQIVGNIRLGMAHMFWGEARPAQLLLQNAVKLAGEDRVVKTGSATLDAVASRALLASTLAHIGEFRKGTEYGEEALRIAEGVDHPPSVAYALLHLSWLYDLRGDLPQALARGERGIAICRELNISFFLVSLLGIFGHAQVLSGRPEEALSTLQEGVSIQEAMGYRSTMSAIVSVLAEAHLRTGSLPAASDNARRALALARQCGERFQEARVLWILGQIHAHPDHPDLDAAERACRESLALASALDMRPLVAECHLALGKLSRRAKNREQAREHLATATAMFQAMEMALWLEEAAAETAALVGGRAAGRKRKRA